MSTPENDFDAALDDSNDAERRENAIDELRTANECDALAELVRTSDLDERYREHALEKLATPQCKPTLESLVERDDVPDSLTQRGGELLEETPDDVGAGP